MAQQCLPSPPSKPGAFNSSSAHQLLGRHFTSNPCTTAWDGRALPSAHGRTTQSAFLFLGPTTQSAFLLLGPTTQSAFLFLGPKMESSVLEGGGFGYAWHLSPSPVHSEDWPLLGPHFGRGIFWGFKPARHQGWAAALPCPTGWRAPRNTYCIIMESRTLSATVGLQTAGPWREAATHGFPLPACSK